MKLQVRYNFVNLVTATIVMLITGVIYYQAISLILTRQKDKDLKVEEEEVFDYVKLNNRLTQTFDSNDQQITFSAAAPGTVKREFINTFYLRKWDDDDRHKHHHRGAGR